MDNETTTSLMNKNLDDLTVGDALKINLAAVAIMAGVTVAVTGGSVAWSKMVDWRERKSIEKANRRNVIDV